MEPVTHLLTGACLARTGFHSRIAYATVAMTVAAEFPDIDTLWSVRGPVSGFQHHRGITHSFVGIPVEAALLLFGVFLWDRRRHHRSASESSSRPMPRSAYRPSTRWLALYGAILLALSSHLLLDYTNNYGIRPFLPFSARWYAGSFVFIFDPLLFLLLLGGLLLPVLFGLIGQEIEGKRGAAAPSGWARAALAFVVCFWLFRAYEHGRAVALAREQTIRASQGSATQEQDAALPGGAFAAPEPVRPLLQGRRSLASPDPFSPFRWYVATDFGPAYLLGTADTRVGAIAPGPLLNKPAPSPALSAAEASRLGRVYLDWSTMPWITLSPDRFGTTVTFEDVRFIGSSPLLNRGKQPPLSGFVVVGPGGDLVQGMDERVEPTRVGR